jgi:hypothetical protein
MSDNEKVLPSLRKMAWQRAKGELLSILETYWNHSYKEMESAQFEEMDKRINGFIKDVEDNW